MPPIAVLKGSGVQFVETKLRTSLRPRCPPFFNGEMGSIFEPLITSGRSMSCRQATSPASKQPLELPPKDYLKAMRLRRLMQGSRAGSSVRWTSARPGEPGIASKIDQPLDRGAATPTQGSRLPLHHSHGQSRQTPRPGAPLRLHENMPVALQ
jgi:hypothetical protein